MKEHKGGSEEADVIFMVVGLSVFQFVPEFI